MNFFVHFYCLLSFCTTTPGGWSQKWRVDVVERSANDCKVKGMEKYVQMSRILLRSYLLKLDQNIGCKYQSEDGGILGSFYGF